MKRLMSGAAAGRAGLVCAMLLVSTLTGCGGGGDSSAGPPVGGSSSARPIMAAMNGVNVAMSKKFWTIKMPRKPAREPAATQLLEQAGEPVEALRL